MPKRKAQTTAANTAPADNTIKCADGSQVYENRIYELADEYINNVLNDPNDIFNPRQVTGVFKYIYNHCIGDLLNNKNKAIAHRYNDIKLLDRLFNIYIDLCYKYNNIPTILEYCLFTGINRDTLNEWINNNQRGLTPEYADTVKTWRQTCELAQVKEKDIKSIFLLKASYGYNDNHVAQENTTPQLMQADALPVISSDPETVPRQIAQQIIDVDTIENG